MQGFKEFMATDLPPILQKTRGGNLPKGHTDPDIISVQNVNAGRTFDAGPKSIDPIDAMMSAVRSILTDEGATVETIGKDQQKFGSATAWGKLYPNVTRTGNEIQIQYWQTATQNIFGKAAWSTEDMTERPWQVAKEKLGLRTSPEHFYRSQFENELTRLANQKLLLGWPENWKISTATIGRDITLTEI